MMEMVYTRKWYNSTLIVTKSVSKSEIIKRARNGRDKIFYKTGGTLLSAMRQKNNYEKCF